ncbi:MFS transporter [Galactobacter caseinivorans]|uniref:MFS transporter n=2 Tax=Galactobacter caseinivorans TaxID=2676123 RepID=A0A496PFK5_9MICC|nr:MFS transporter [Galactobacter caseinivorans]
MNPLGLAVMMLTSFVLVVAEFIPSGILTPMAQSLGVTPGQAGQTVTVTAFVGFLVAPTVAALVPRMDRRKLLVILALVAAVSNLGVALAPNLWLVLAARVLLGAALSGFWAMSMAVASSLASPDRLGRAMSRVTLGTSVATVAGVPIAVVISTFADWRVIFVGAAVLSVLAALLLRLVLPPVPATPGTGLRQLIDTLRRPGIRLGLLGHVLTVLGQIAAYTFMRLALERVDGITPTSLALLLVLYGVGGFAGNIIVGRLVDRHLIAMAYGVPGLIALGVFAVALLPGSLAAVAIAVLLWGAGFGAWLVVINTWIGRTAPDRLESGGGLVVTGFQLAIMLGAALGGLVVDAAGVVPTFLAAGVILAAGSVLFGAAARSTQR